MQQISGWAWGRQGADLYEDRLTWYDSQGDAGFASGAACDQTLDDFLARGPWVDGVPTDVLSEVSEAVRAVVEDGGR